MQLVTAKQDFARLMLGLFAGSYPSHPLTFAYAGQAEAPQGRADVIDVKGAGRLRRAAVRGRQDAPAGDAQLAGASAAGSRPRSRGARPAVRRRPVHRPQGRRRPAGLAAAGRRARVGRPAPPPTVENRLYFAEYRSFDGLQLPTRVRRAVAGDTTEETTFDRFRINARVDPRRFEPGS